MGTIPPSALAASTLWTQHPTAASVGPYSFTTSAPGAHSRSRAASSAGRFSPPSTHTRAADRIPSGPSCSASTARWPGVSFTIPKPGPSRNARASGSAPTPSSRTATARPASRGRKRLVTVRSKESELCSGAPAPSPRGYASAAHSR